MRRLHSKEFSDQSQMSCISRPVFGPCFASNPFLSLSFLWGKPSRRKRLNQSLCAKLEPRLPFWNFQIYHRQWRYYYEVDAAYCDAYPPPHSRDPNSMDWTINVEVRHLVFSNKKLLLLTFSRYAAAASLTRLTRRGKIRGANEGMNDFESTLVSSSNFMALRRVW